MLKGGWCKRSDFNRKYEAWCARNEITKEKDKERKHQLKEEFGIEPERRKGGEWYYEMALLDDGDEDYNQQVLDDALTRLMVRANRKR